MRRAAPSFCRRLGDGGGCWSLVSRCAVHARSIRNGRGARRRDADRPSSVRSPRRDVSAVAAPRAGPAGLLAHSAADRISGDLISRARSRCAAMLRSAAPRTGKDRRRGRWPRLRLPALSLSWLLVSTLGDNNDLGAARGSAGRHGPDRGAAAGMMLRRRAALLIVATGARRTRSQPAGHRADRMRSNIRRRRRRRTQACSRKRRNCGPRCAATRRRPPASPTTRFFCRT